MEDEKCRMESDLLFELLKKSGKIKSSFTGFSSHLFSLGNLTEKLLSSVLHSVHGDDSAV